LIESEAAVPRAYQAKERIGIFRNIVVRQIEQVNEALQS
jgi:hypothetical protein